MTLFVEVKKSLSPASQKRDQGEQNTGRRLELQGVLGEHGETKFGWSTDRMRERERISVALGSYTEQGEGKSKVAGLWLVGALGASPRLKGRVGRPLAEIKLQP